MNTSHENKPNIPNATTVLVLGILSLVFCWCYGIIGLILGIIAVVLASGSRKIYLQNPDAYTEASYKNLNAGRTCGIIGICLGVILFIVGIILFVFMLHQISTGQIQNAAWM